MALEVGNGRQRVVIERVTPQVDGGRFPIKRTVGETVEVEADIFADGHDAISAAVIVQHGPDREWTEVRMTPVVNDRWRGEFAIGSLATHGYSVLAWVDRFLTWKRDMVKRLAARQAVAVDLLVGVDLIGRSISTSTGAAKERLVEYQRSLRSADERTVRSLIESPELAELMHRYGTRDFVTRYTADLFVAVDRERAAFSAWYELFPRSAGRHAGHGTLQDVLNRLPYVAGMGFDVLYLPPIHPIGRTHRKGPNNATAAGEGDPGSPWAIGGEEGGHKSIHAELGTIDDFRRLVTACRETGLELAMDIAFQCSPDHPYVKEHPEWFRHRPDGSIQYAENPPKKYQDIYPFDFECDGWESLWKELLSIFIFWADEGVRIFRVDNPHTKPFPFWEWVIAEVRQSYPDALFLAEAFTRPKIMHRLAKAGFNQSYTYFAWRDTKYELVSYLTELTRSESREFFRPNLWPNTPDILPASLQIGTRAAFMSRLVLAATLSGNYGIYGPPFEHLWSAPREPGSEEYLDSEKYQIHQHDLDRPDSLKDFIARVNSIRRSSKSLTHRGSLEFHSADNDQVVCYSRVSPDGSDIVLVVVNLDAHYTQSAWIELPTARFDLPESRPYQMHDLLTDARYLWHGDRNYIQLDPAICPAHIFRLRRHARTERDFDYFL